MRWFQFLFLKEKDPKIVDQDEEFKNVFLEKIPNLRPAFDKEGTITAANASTLNDGASCLILASEEAVKKNGLSPIAKIVSYADAAHEHEGLQQRLQKLFREHFQKPILKLQILIFGNLIKHFQL